MVGLLSGVEQGNATNGWEVGSMQGDLKELLRVVLEGSQKPQS